MRFFRRFFLPFVLPLLCDPSAYSMSMQAYASSSTIRHPLPFSARNASAIRRGGKVVSNPSLPTTELKMTGGETDSRALPKQPDISRLIRFYIPCLALWISQPLLSLVDTASVGLSASPGAGASSLGALGPATTFIDGASYLFAFLNVATTNLYASALADDSRENPRFAGDSVVRTASKTSIFCGAAILYLLIKYGRAILGMYIGPEVMESVLGEEAFGYVKIRSYSMPTTLLYGVLQAALLGAKDSSTALVAVVVSTLFNVVGDLYLVVIKKMGVKGAAIATLIAQIAGTMALIGPARSKLFATRSERTKKISEGTYKKVSTASFLSFAAPVLTLVLGKLAAFGVMTHVAASLPGETSLAAHQIVLSLFFFVSPFLEVLSQTAQAFLPQFYIARREESAVSPTDAAALEKEAATLSRRLMGLGLTLAAVVAAVASSVPAFFPGLLTNDAMVGRSLKPLAVPLALGSLLTAPVAVAEGVLLARRELNFLAGTYILSTAVFPFFLFGIKKAKGPVSHVWVGFALFQLFRASCFTGRIWLGPLLGKVFTRKGKKNSGKAKMA